VELAARAYWEERAALEVPEARAVLGALGAREEQVVPAAQAAQGTAATDRR
jgi:hypothetical protein